MFAKYSIANPWEAACGRGLSRGLALPQWPPAAWPASDGFIAGKAAHKPLLLRTVSGFRRRIMVSTVLRRRSSPSQPSSRRPHDLHEYQKKELFAAYGIPAPAGKVASTRWRRRGRPGVAAAPAVKAQVRGRARQGGRRQAGEGPEEARSRTHAQHEDRTYQTGGPELPVNQVLIGEAVDIGEELYLSALVDRAHRCVTFMGSAAGGVNIEEIAATEPEKIITVRVDNTAGLQPFQSRQMGFGMGLNAGQVRQLGKIMSGFGAAGR
jgi:hypothetical protein